MGMIIEPGSKFFGLEAKLARDIIHEIHAISCSNIEPIFSLGLVDYAIEKFIPTEDEQYIHPYLFEKKLKDAEDKRKEITNKIILEEWIISAGDDKYELSSKAITLSRHKFIKRISRYNALQKLSEFLYRVIDWNNTNPYVKVDGIWLYGSMLTNSSDVGDVDLVCQYLNNPLSPTYPSEHERVTDFMRGIEFLDKVKKHIRNRSPYISIDGFYAEDMDMINGGVLQLMNNGILTSSALDLIAGIQPEKKEKKTKEKKWFYLGIEKKLRETQFGINTIDAKNFFNYIARGDLYNFVAVISDNDIRYAVENYVYNKNKKLGQRYWTDNSLKESCELTPILKENLINDGFIASYSSECFSSGGYYMPTKKGIEFGLLKLQEPIQRKKANKMLKTFLERVFTWNSENHYMKVKNAWAYGAIVTDSEEVGDIELICDFEHNPSSPEHNFDDHEKDLLGDSNLFMFSLPSDVRVNHYNKLEENADRFFSMRLPRISIQKNNAELLEFVQREVCCIQIVKDNEVIYSAHE